jgi:hypothetical protein
MPSLLWVAKTAINRSIRKARWGESSQGSVLAICPTGSGSENPMKRRIVLLSAACLLAGCASRYDILTTGGGDFTNVTKPKFVPGTRMYVFKDVRGTEYYLPETRVREINVR